MRRTATPLKATERVWLPDVVLLGLNNNEYNNTTHSRVAATLSIAVFPAMCSAALQIQQYQRRIRPSGQHVPYLLIALLQTYCYWSCRAMHVLNNGVWSSNTLNAPCLCWARSFPSSLTRTTIYYDIYARGAWDLLVACSQKEGSLHIYMYA